MEKSEIYLKTLFCCSACDCDIAPEEVALIKDVTDNNLLFKDINVQELLNNYVNDINKAGKQFLKAYLNDLASVELTEKEQITLVDLAIKMIEADNQILYSEVCFFKKIRQRLTVSDAAILSELPNCEDYLLPDIASENKDFEDVGSFALIKLH